MRSPTLVPALPATLQSYRGSEGGSTRITDRSLKVMTDAV